MDQQVFSDDPRIVLDQLVRDRGEDYAALSRMIGKNPAYIQQFIKRGTPRYLGERDRALLAAYFRIDESLLGAPQRAAPPPPLPPTPALPMADGRRGAAGLNNGRAAGAAGRGGMAPAAGLTGGLAGATGLMAVPRIDIGASAGAGGLGEEDWTQAVMAFEPRWLRRLSATPQRLAIIRVDGDSMVPTLGHGDDIMVDSGDGVERLRDGIYVLRRDGVLLVKRLACSTAQRGHIHIISDNAIYPPERDAPVASLAIVGRVVWTGRQVG